MVCCSVMFRARVGQKLREVRGGVSDVGPSDSGGIENGFNFLLVQMHRFWSSTSVM